MRFVVSGGLFMLALVSLSACQSSQALRPVSTLGVVSLAPYVQELAVDAPLGHWRLDGGVDGALSGPKSRATRFEGGDHAALLAEGFGGRALTVSLWARGIRSGTLMSYATKGHDDALVLSCRGGMLAVALLDEVARTDVACPSKDWASLGLAWRSDDGQMVLAVDGFEAWRASVGQGRAVPVGGAVVLGQRQGCVGGCFDDGLVGDLDEAVLFERALPSSRLLGHASVALGRRAARPLEGTQDVRIVPQFSHSGRVRAAAFSPDGRLLATASGSVVKVVDTRSGRVVFELLGHARPVVGVVFSPDGARLASASDDLTIKVWDVFSGSVAFEMGPLPNRIVGVGFDSDGLTLAAGLSDGQAIFWEASTGKERARVQAHSTQMSAFVTGPDGLFVSVGDDNTAGIIDGRAATIAHTLKPEIGAVKGVAISPDGRVIAFGGEGGGVALVDTASGTIARKIASGGRAILQLAFSPDGAALAVVCKGGVMGLWDPATGARLHDLSDKQMMVARAVFADDGRVLVSGYSNGALWRWDTRTGKRLSEAMASAEVLAASPDGLLSASGGSDGQIRIWDPRSGALVHDITRQPAIALKMSFSPTGRWLATGSIDDTVKIWDAHTAKLAFNLDTGQTVRSLAYRPDGRALAVAPGLGPPTLWDPRTGTILKTLEGEHEVIKEMIFMPNGQELVGVDSLGGALVFWDAVSGEQLGGIEVEDRVESFGIDALGHWMVAGTDEGQALVWDLRAGQLLHTLQAHDGEVVLVRFMGGRLVTAGDDGVVKVWDVQRGALEARLLNHADESGVLALDIAQSEEGEPLLASGGRDRAVTVSRERSGWEKVAGLDTVSDVPRGVVFSPDGQLLFVQAQDVHVYPLDKASVGAATKLSFQTGRLRSMKVSPDGRLLATAGSGGTVRLWSRDTQASVVLLSSGEDWVSATDEGYFDASPRGASLLALTSGQRSFGIDQMALALNRPDILIERLGALDFDPAVMPSRFAARHDAAMAALDYDKAARATHRDQLERKRDHFHARHLRRLKKASVAPEDLVDWRTGLPLARIVDAVVEDNGDARLELSFRDQRALARYQIYVNDVPVHSEPPRIEGRRVSLTAVVELSGGANKIEVAAINARGQESDRDLIALEREEAPRGALYFVGFGVSDYLYDEIPDLSFAHQDTIDLAETFAKAGAAFDAVHIHKFTDEAVTPEAIAKASGLLAEVGVHDTVVLFVAGHGVRDTDPAHTYYYLTHGTRLADLKGTAVDFEAIEALLYDVKARKKLFLMDTCQSGEVDDDAALMAMAGGGGEGGLSARAIPSKARTAVFGASPEVTRTPVVTDRERFIYQDLARRSGAIVLSSSRGEEYSLESAAYQNGAFTEEILRALRSDVADLDGDGSISTDELRGHVIKAVPALTGDRQHPTVDRDNLFQTFVLPVVAE